MVLESVDTAEKRLNTKPLHPKPSVFGLSRQEASTKNLENRTLSPRPELPEPEILNPNS